MKLYMIAVLVGFLMMGTVSAQDKDAAPSPAPPTKQEAQKQCEKTVEQEEERRLYKEEIDKCVTELTTSKS